MNRDVRFKSVPAAKAAKVNATASKPVANSKILDVSDLEESND